MNHYESSLLRLTEVNPDIYVMTAENLAPIRNIYKSIGDRFIDTGIAEQCMIGIAAGLASRNRVVICHALAAFLTMRSYEFIRTDLGISRANVNLVGFVPGLLSDGNGPTHQAIEDISLMKTVPNMHIYAPLSIENLSKLLPSILAEAGPSYIRYPKNEYSTNIPESHISPNALTQDVTPEKMLVVSYGYIAENAYSAYSYLKYEQGLSLDYLCMEKIHPLTDYFVNHLNNFERILFVEDHREFGSLYEDVLKLKGLGKISGRLFGLNLGNSWFKPGHLAGVEEASGLNTASIVRKITTINES